MTIAKPLLSQRAVIQAALETTYNVAASVGNSDGVLGKVPAYTIQPNVLERDFTRNDLSPLAIVIGRKLARLEFETEFRGNGKENSGKPADAPILARLIQACGYALSGKRGNSVIGPFQTNDQANPVAWTTSGAVAAGTFTSTGNPGVGDAFVVDTVTYTVRATLTTVGDVLQGVNAQATLANLADAINGNQDNAGLTFFAGTSPAPDVHATSTTTTLVVTANSPGTWANTLGTTYTAASSSEGAWGAATLAGGAVLATNTDVVCYEVTVSTGGASGTAQAVVTSGTTGESLAAATLTTATPFTVGTLGLTLTPVFTGNLVVGQQWIVWALPPGILLSPVSDNFQSITLVADKDGVKHTLPGAFGTFEITAMAGSYATIKFTFTGTYQVPTFAALPAPNFETTIPHQVELGELRIDSFRAIVGKFTFNQANDIQIIEDVSSVDGYAGSRIVGRKPEGGIDPLMELTTTYDFWGKMSAAQRMGFSMRCGTVDGNAVWFIGTNAQYSGLSYTDRNSLLALQAGLRFARQNSNDETFIFFK